MLINLHVFYYTLMLWRGGHAVIMSMHAVSTIDRIVTAIFLGMQHKNINNSLQSNAYLTLQIARHLSMSYHLCPLHRQLGHKDTYYHNQDSKQHEQILQRAMVLHVVFSPLLSPV